MDSTTDEMHFSTVLIASVSPICIVFIASIFWLVHYLIFRDEKVKKNQLIASIVVMLFLVHPEIISTIFKHLSCKELDNGNFYLETNYSIRCYDGKHMKYIWMFAIPSLVLWVFGIPMFMLCILIKLRKGLKQTDIRIKLGFLYNGYKGHKYFWEVLIVYREIAIISIAVLLQSWGIDK